MTAKALRVLRVDDEPDISNRLEAVLKLKGFEVYGFTDPREALEKFNPNYYDLIVSDIKNAAYERISIMSQNKIKTLE